MHPTSRFRLIRHLIYGQDYDAGIAAPWRREHLGRCGISMTSCDWYHIPPRYWHTWPWGQPKFVTFCVVRDPLERALSMYKHWVGSEDSN